MLAALVLAVTAPGCRRGGPGPDAPAGAFGGAGDDSGDVLRRVEAWGQADGTRDPEALAAHYDHGTQVVRIHQGKRATGWQAVEPQLRIVVGKATAIHVRLEDLQVVALAPGAVVVTAAMTREVSDGVTAVTEAGILSLVLRRDGGAWLITAEHYSYGSEAP